MNKAREIKRSILMDFRCSSQSAGEYNLLAHFSFTDTMHTIELVHGV